MNISRRNLIIGTGSCLVLPSLNLLSEAEASTYKADSRESLYHESDEIILARMLFGEARSKNVSVSERIAIGFTPTNRFKNSGAKSLAKVILFPRQYSCFNPEDPNLEKVLDPEKYEPEAWEKSLRISEAVLKGEYDYANFGPTHYHRKGTNPEWAKHMIEKLPSAGFVHQFYRGAFKT